MNIKNIHINKIVSIIDNFKETTEICASLASNIEKHYKIAVNPGYAAETYEEVALPETFSDVERALDAAKLKAKELAEQTMSDGAIGPHNKAANALHHKLLKKLTRLENVEKANFEMK